ncbi:MAG TPA: tetratricopeptide repeat protein [Blastocatellia bacterium]|nr:tetratricopeptide repeat protein [Blastocatellia bacterium]
MYYATYTISILTSLRGRHHFHRLTPEGVGKGVEYFRRAIERDRDYALAWVGLTDCYNYLAKRAEAREAAVRALELDDQMAEARASLAFHRFLYDWDFQGAEREFRRALELNPNYAEAHHWYAIYLANLARHGEALREARRAEELDPVSPLMCMTPGLAFFCARTWDEALEEFRKVADLDPHFMPARSLLGHVYEQKGMYEKALAEYARVVEVVGEETEPALTIKAAVGRIEARRGRKSEARKIAAELSQSQHLNVLTYFIAAIHAALGEKDQAFEWLDRACESHNLALLSLKIDPNFALFHTERRFADLLERIGFEPQPVLTGGGG